MGILICETLRDKGMPLGRSQWPDVSPSNWISNTLTSQSFVGPIPFVGPETFLRIRGSFTVGITPDQRQLYGITERGRPIASNKMVNSGPRFTSNALGILSFSSAAVCGE